MPTKRQAGKPTATPAQNTDERLDDASTLPDATSAGYWNRPLGDIVRDEVLRDQERIDKRAQEIAGKAIEEAERGFEIERPILYFRGFLDGASKQKKNTARHAATADRPDALGSELLERLSGQTAPRGATASELLKSLIRDRLICECHDGFYEWVGKGGKVPRFHRAAFKKRVERARKKLRPDP